MIRFILPLLFALTGCSEGGFCIFGTGGGVCPDAIEDLIPECVPTADFDVCGNGVDEDCDGSDESCPLIDCDGDNDGHGRIDCDGDMTVPADDCNDSDASVHPGAPELCDGPDKNCDGIVADCPTPTDCDRDGDGVDGSFGLECGGSDCNDNDASVHPGAPELCDGPDKNCDGIVADCPTVTIELGADRVDNDGDGYADEGITPIRHPNGRALGYMTISFPEPGSVGLRAQPCIYGSVLDVTNPDTVQGLGRCMPQGGFSSEGATSIGRGDPGLANLWPDAWVHQALDCEAALQGVTGAPGHNTLLLRMASPNGVVSSTFTVTYTSPAVCSAPAP